MELLPFVDILKVFNNPINEEQAWAVCYQCAHFLQRNPSQEFYQDVYDSGIHSIWLSRHGDVLLRKGPSDPNGSGKGPPQHGQPTPSSSSTSTIISSSSSWKTTTTHQHRSKPHVLATETDAVQALGTAIFEALDYGIDQSEERQLSPELEAIIVSMTSSAADDPEAASNGDDEGIEKDADVETRCTVLDVIKMCVRHLSAKQDASHHYKAVCRALATEAGELFTFLDKVAAGKELVQTEDEDARRLEELQRADWACLWVQVMRSLRQGVRLKKVEHVHLPPLEYELTPFEMILEDIRSRRYTLTKIMVNGDIPHKVKNDAHAVILNFIRSRPPLKKVDERKLKPKPNPVPDPHQLLLNEIRSRPKLRPVREGKLVVESVGVRSTSDARPGQKDTTLKSPSKPVKKIIKPDFNLLLNNSFEESSDDDDRSSNHSPGTLDFRLRQHPRSDSMTTTPPPQHTWQRAVTRETLLREGQPGRGGSRLQRRHTITICEAPVEPQVDLPVVQEEDEEQQQPSPVRDSSSSSNNSRNVTLTRSSHSDNDLQGHMRQGQGLVRRASFDNRRAITSQASLGLTSIPELEDDGMLAARSKPQEHCPPPNLSPPCKGRSKTGLAMVGMKPSGAPYHPSTLRSSSDPACKPGAPYHPSTLRSSSDPTCKPGAPYHPSSLRSSSDPTCKPGAPYHPSSLRSNVVAAAAAAPKPSRIPDSMQHAVSSKPPQHASFNSSASLSSSMSPSSLSSASVLPHTSLDHSLSCQSPGYKKKFPRPNTSMPDTDSVKEERISRWRTAASAQTSRTENRENMAQQIPSPSPRRWAQTSRTHVREDMAREIPSLSPRRWASRVTDIEDDEIPPQPAGHKRLSLDAGMSLYYDEVLRQDGHDSLPSSPYLARDRKTSVGLDRGVSARMGFRRTKTPEEEEKIQRWRVLQEEDREARLSGQRGEAVRRTGVTRLPESTDVLQQRMAGEEERFERWRRLEEGSHSQSLLQQFNLRSPLASPSLKRHNTVSYCPEKQQYHGMDPSQQATWSSHQDQSADSVPLCDMPKRWQNPVECLSLTLEEVTHIRSVLTKAELESLMSHAALYQQVAKSKLCFTCKTTRFALFGEWGTKCKFCKRTVCSKCLRKMNVPADHFRNIPVYALSPTPFTQEMEEFIHQFIRSAPPPSVPATREPSPTRPSVSAGSAGSSKPLARSQSALHTTTTSTKVSVSSSLKGPLLAICCDCKSMVMEIIRATRASLTLLSSQSQNTGTLNVSARQYLANSKLASN